MLVGVVLATFLPILLNGHTTHAGTLHACSMLETPDGQEVVLEGEVLMAFESSNFKVEGSDCELWIRGELDALCEMAGGCGKMADIHARISARGIVSESGNHGHMGLWEREFRVLEILSADSVH